MLALYVFTDVPLILFHRLFVPNSEMWMKNINQGLSSFAFTPVEYQAECGILPGDKN